MRKNQKDTRKSRALIPSYSKPVVIKMIQRCPGSFISYSQLVMCGVLSENPNKKDEGVAVFKLPHITIHSGIQRWCKDSVLEFLKK